MFAVQTGGNQLVPTRHNQLQPDKNKETWTDLTSHISIAVLVVLGHGWQVGGEFGGCLYVQVAPGDSVKKGVLLQRVVPAHFLTANPL